MDTRNCALFPRSGAIEWASSGNGLARLRNEPRSVQRPKERPCTSSELARLKSEFEKAERDRADKKRIEAEQMAKMFGLPGLDDESNRAFAAKLMKYAGWRSVKYRGHGVFDVDYHFVRKCEAGFPLPGASRQ